MINIDILRQIDEQSHIKLYNASKVLSMNLLDTFIVYELSLLSTTFYMLELKKENERILNIEKQIEMIKEKLKKDIVIYLENATAYEIKQYILRKIAFITNKNDYYLPFLALKMKLENSKSKIEVFSEKFSPHSQLLFLYMLYSDKNEFNNKDIIQKLEMNEMSFSRAVNDLINKKLLRYNLAGKTGRMKTYYLEDKKNFYNNGKNYLFNPVAKEYFVSNKCDTTLFMKASVYGLSDRTMISNDSYKTYAAYKKKFANISDYIVDYKIGLNENYNKILLLKYDPKLLAIDNKMDPITLSLTVRDKNERIEKEISKMMEGYKWYTD